LRTTEGSTIVARTLIAVDTTSVYWVDCHGSILPIDCTISSVPTGGGPVVTLVTNQNSVWSLAVDSSFVFWGAAEPPCYVCPAEWSGIQKVPLAGGAPASIAPDWVALDIAVDSTSVYWGTEVGQIRVVPKAGGTTQTLIDRFAWGVALDTTFVYFASPSAIGRVPKGGGAATAVACGGTGPLAADETSFYWTRVEDGALMRTPSGGGAPALVAAAQGVRAIALGGCSVCWIAGDAVMKAPKPPLAGDGGSGDTSCALFPHCDAAITCAYDSDCPAGTCVTASCDSYCCNQTPAAKGSDCPWVGGLPAFCDGNGSCVPVKKGCNGTGKCNTAADCCDPTATCINGFCM
jgi:hypothetical protein